VFICVCVCVCAQASGPDAPHDVPSVVRAAGEHLPEFPSLPPEDQSESKTF